MDPASRVWCHRSTAVSVLSDAIEDAPRSAKELQPWITTSTTIAAGS
jgi:hypothetical protein